MRNCCCSDEILVLPGTGSFTREGISGTLNVTSAGIRGGIIQDRFGRRGEEVVDGMPTRSLPFSVSGAPDGTASYALTLLDYDAIGAVGFLWIHWLAANIRQPGLPENASVELRGEFAQGVNSWGAPLLGAGAFEPAAASCYGGMAPPDSPHRYVLTVYAMDQMLNLRDGFRYHEFLEGISGHILAAGVLVGIYDN